MKHFSDRLRNNKRVALIALCIVLAVSVPVTAWYAYLRRQSRTDELGINIPPIIYIKDDNLQEMTSFNLDGLRLGEDYNAVFCVSPAVPDSVNNFFLGLIYTENLGMEINLYPVSEVTGTAPTTEGALCEAREVFTGNGSDTTTCYFNYATSDTGDYKQTYGDWENDTPPAAGGSLNNGIYKAYRNLQFAEASETGTGLIDELNDRRKYRFFILHISWTENAANRADNAKETDIVYIVSKGTRKSGT